MRTRWEGNSGGGRGVMARQMNWIEHFAISHSSRDPVLSRIRTPDADASPTLNPTSRTADRNDTNIPPQIQPSFLTSGRHATGSGGGSGGSATMVHPPAQHQLLRKGHSPAGTQSTWYHSDHLACTPSHTHHRHGSQHHPHPRPAPRGRSRASGA